MKDDIMLRAAPITRERVAQIVKAWKEQRGLRITQRQVVDELVQREYRALFWPGADSRPIAAKEQTDV